MLIELKPIPFLSHAEQIARRKQIRARLWPPPIPKHRRLQSPSNIPSPSPLQKPFLQPLIPQNSPATSIGVIETTTSLPSPEQATQEPPPPITPMEKARQLALRIPRPLTTRAILRIAATFYDLDIETITSSSRKQNIMRPRQIVCYFAKQFTKNSLPEIGRRIGGRDHTTVLHAVRRIASLVATDPSIARQAEQLRDILAPPPVLSPLLPASGTPACGGPPRFAARTRRMPAISPIEEGQTTASRPAAKGGSPRPLCWAAEIPAPPPLAHARRDPPPPPLHQPPARGCGDKSYYWLRVFHSKEFGHKVL